MAVTASRWEDSSNGVDTLEDVVPHTDQIVNDLIEGLAGNDRHSSVLSIIIPTRNESEGIAVLVERLQEAVRTPAEVIFVDDSDDNTPFEVQLQARRLIEQKDDSLTLRLVHRPPGQRAGGLGTAVQEGMRRSRGEWICVVDADLQHPPEVIDSLLEVAERDGLDVAVGSRYVDGGSLVAMSKMRQGMSRGCAVAAKAIFPRRLSDVSDPLSGFFVVRRSAIDVERLQPDGFKILLEILGRHPRLQIGEVGYVFSDRSAGLSKASVREATRYGRQLARLRVSRAKPVKPPNVSYYDIYGIMTVASAVALPELKAFRVRSLSVEPDIRLTLSRAKSDQHDFVVDLDKITPHLRYVETFGNAGFAVEVDCGDRVEIAISEFVAKSPHVVYTNIIEPVLRWRFVARGYALVHAAGFVLDGQAHLITARTDTGKTTSMLKILENEGTGFISDDLILVDREGMALAYPKPLTISAHTVAALKNTDLNRIERFFLPMQSRLHSRTGRQFAFFLVSRRVPVATLNTAVQRLLPPPKYRVEKLVPGVTIERSAPIASLSVIQAGPEESFEALSNDDGLKLLLENCEDAFGFPPYEHLAGMLKRDGSGGNLADAEEEIISSAFARVPVALVTSRKMLWAEHIWQRVSSAADPQDR